MGLSESVRRFFLTSSSDRRGSLREFDDRSLKAVHRLRELKVEVGKFAACRVEEFRKLGENREVVFDFNPFLNLRLRSTLKSELAFCISTANSSAKSGLAFQNEFHKLGLVEDAELISRALKNSGVRFYRRKAEYIVGALKMFDEITDVIAKDSSIARKWLIRNVRGLGWKEASHFLRNIGKRDVAIVDRHVLRWVGEMGFDSKKYAEVERFLGEVARKVGVSLAELDLLIWFDKTGMILK